MNNVKGFTLVELLVTMSLLSMIILIGSSAFKVFSNSWDGHIGRFDLTLKNARNLVLVQDVLDSLVPYVAYDKSGKPIIYFEGNRNGFVAVSSKSIFTPHSYAVVRFSVRQNPDSKYDVLYEEWPMKNAVLDTIGEPLNFSQPLVLFESVSDPKFKYFGWGNITDRNNLGEFGSAPGDWLDNFNGVEALFLPIKTSLSFETRSGNYQIFSSLAREVPGLLSRYKVISSKATDPSLPVEADEDCFC